ncbi:type II toxin-antitoxin system HigB family toxin [Candidatus Accumulibacter aalborgensis]|uniref:type II toxin-antitoxin system HigB family toxin n=1 Tax=Candidatus Accumulibacter aalborgensis TaxID=1860102 RepID=UPI00164482E4
MLLPWSHAAHLFTRQTKSDIKEQYRSASVLKNRRIVFNIKGNDYRLIVAIAYNLQIVYVKFVGTHTGTCRPGKRGSPEESGSYVSLVRSMSGRYSW